MGRTLIAGLLGGIVMFIWTSLAHTALPLGEMGIGEIPDDAAAIAMLHDRLGDKDGLYMFPGAGVPAGTNVHQDADAMKRVEARIRSEPSGLLVYHPAGRETAMTSYIGREVVLEIFQALILAWLVAGSVASTLPGRTLTATAVGVAVAVATNGSNWIWYGYPLDFTLASIITQVVGYAVAGLAIALILGMKRKAATG